MIGRDAPKRNPKRNQLPGTGFPEARREVEQRRNHRLNPNLTDAERQKGKKRRYDYVRIDSEFGEIRKERNVTSEN